MVVALVPHLHGGFIDVGTGPGLLGFALAIIIRINSSCCWTASANVFALSAR